MRINDISLSPDLARFRDAYRESLISGHRTIDAVVGHLVRSHGKGIRPMLVLLCARLGAEDGERRSQTVTPPPLNPPRKPGGRNAEIARIAGGSDWTAAESRPPLENRPPGERAIDAAVIVELLHEATLVHDDVVDEAAQRRGFPSLPARFKNKVAVLFGDYMLANVLARTLEARDLEWLDILSDTARRMARGELLQAARSRRLDMSEEDYLKMIGDKTAALFSAACRLGGLTGGLQDGGLDALGTYGEALGIAFQIRDDLLDLFGDGRGLGKPTGGDLKERKLTLPLIAALEKVDQRQARRIRARIRRGIKRKEFALIRDFIREHGGEVYANKTMQVQVDRAMGALKYFPESDNRKQLEDLVRFTVERNR